MKRKAAITTLNKFFAGSQSDSVTPETIFLNYSRDLAKDKENRQWLSNKLTLMKPYGFVSRQRGKRDGASVLSKLTLTPEGKKALGRENLTIFSSVQTPTIQQSVTIEKEVSLETVYRDVKRLQRQLPSFDIVFEIKPKEVLY